MRLLTMIKILTVRTFLFIKVVFLYFQFSMNITNIFYGILIHAFIMEFLGRVDLNSVTLVLLRWTIFRHDLLIAVSGKQTKVAS